jgi:hypothetical protein
MLLIQGNNQAPPSILDSWYNAEERSLSRCSDYCVEAMLRVFGKRTLPSSTRSTSSRSGLRIAFAATIIEKDVTQVEGAAALATLIAMQLVLAEAVRWKWADRFVNGRQRSLTRHIHSACPAQGRITERLTRRDPRSGIKLVEDGCGGTENDGL